MTPAAYDTKKSVKLRKEKKEAAIAAAAAANGGKGYKGLEITNISGSYKLQYTNFLQEKGGFELAVTIKDVDGAALVFAKPHEVRVQLLGEVYQSDLMYKRRLEDTVHNGSSYGELGSDAANKKVRLQTAKALKNKLPAGKYKTEWLTGWLAEWEEEVH
jgi:hypothetical protein